MNKVLGLKGKKQMERKEQFKNVLDFFYVD